MIVGYLRAVPHIITVVACFQYVPPISGIEPPQHHLFGEKKLLNCKLPALVFITMKFLVCGTGRFSAQTAPIGTNPQVRVTARVIATYLIWEKK